jgi:hypothetical protein
VRTSGRFLQLDEKQSPARASLPQPSATPKSAAAWSSSSETTGIMRVFIVHADLERYRERVLGLASAPTITHPGLADYDERYVLRNARP